MSAVEVSDLRKSYGKREAVRGIAFTIEAGEVFGLLGPNGAGKTTTVEILEGYRHRDAGTVRVLGVDPQDADPSWRERVGVVLQSSSLYPNLTVLEHLRAFGDYYTAPRDADEVIELVGLGDKRDARVRTLSGGQKRRLDLGLALVGDPEVLFLDEPTTGLDPASRLTVWDEVRRINAEGATVFLTTQYLEEADVLCDRLAIIDNGQIVAEGTPEQLKAEMGHDVVSVSVEGADVAATEAALAGLPSLERVVPEAGAVALYVEDGAGSIAEIVRRLEHGQIDVGAISVARPSLDDVFLMATGRRLEGQEQSGQTTEVDQ